MCNEFVNMFDGYPVNIAPFSATYDLLTDGIATVAEIEITVGELAFHGRGSARRVKGDRYDQQLGDTLAFQRALSNLVQSMNAFTSKKIKAMDKAAAEKAELSAKAMEQAKAAHPAGKKKDKNRNLSIDDIFGYLDTAYG